MSSLRPRIASALPFAASTRTVGSLPSVPAQQGLQSVQRLIQRTTRSSSGAKRRKLAERVHKQEPNRPIAAPIAAGTVNTSATTKEQRPPVADLFERAHRTCPGCSADMVDRGCKLRCPRCGFFLDCSDG
ncbi:MAG: DUF2477 domain-containing protein [Myxococcales bacterium]|nr:DUF2477 domain-containing protein [Myxococcales bacterium]